MFCNSRHKNAVRQLYGSNSYIINSQRQRILCASQIVSVLAARVSDSYNTIAGSENTLLQPVNMFHLIHRWIKNASVWGL